MILLAQRNLVQSKSCHLRSSKQRSDRATAFPFCFPFLPILSKFDFPLFSFQYIKSETIEPTPEGQVAKAIRQISEKASTRIGKKAFEVALAREQLRSKMGLAAVGGGPKVTVCHKVSISRSYGAISVLIAKR